VRVNEDHAQGMLMPLLHSTRLAVMTMCSSFLQHMTLSTAKGLRISKACTWLHLMLEYGLHLMLAHSYV